AMKVFADVCDAGGPASATAAPYGNVRSIHPAAKTIHQPGIDRRRGQSGRIDVDQVVDIARRQRTALERQPDSGLAEIRRTLDVDAVHAVGLVLFKKPFGRCGEVALVNSA